MEQLSQQMRRDWDERADLDHMHHILNSKPMGYWGVPSFLKSGETFVADRLDPFMDAHRISPKRRTALEIGCGAARETCALAHRFKRVIGLDVSAKMLAHARDNLAREEIENVELIHGDGVSLQGVESAGVSFVYSHITFQHIPDPQIQYNYLREVARVLRPRGWFLIHLYADQADFEQKLKAWSDRAQTGNLMGWSEPARRELAGDRFKTWMQTAVDHDTVLATLDNADLLLKYSEGERSQGWWIGGQKRA
jgi:SAM-dependent methyltransferase